MSNLAQHIQAYFGDISSTELEKITSLFTSKTIKKGEVILQSGQYCKEMHFVQSGLIRMFMQTTDKEVTQWISSQGFFAVDISSFMFDTPSRWTLQTLVETEVYTISKNDYKTLHQQIPTWKDLEHMFIGKCFAMIEDRIFSHLSMNAEERYLSFFEHNKELFNQVPLQYIASMLGMTPETFSRIRKKQLL